MSRKRNGTLESMLIPSFVITLILAVAIMVLPMFFGTMDTAAEENNISTSQYADTYESGTTINIMFIQFLEALMFGFMLLLVVAVVNHFR